MWSKQQIQELKQAAYPFTSDPEIRDCLTELNVQLNNHERQPMVHMKIQMWKDVERKADQIRDKLTSLNFEGQPAN